MKATRVFTSRGSCVTVEPESNPNQCIDCEEIARVEVEVPMGTTCDICGEFIEPERRKVEAIRKRKK